jgi:signal transduction histidine kinase
MRPARLGVIPHSWLRLPRRTARLRLTALYGGLFVICGVTLLGILYLLFARAIQRPDNGRLLVPDGPKYGSGPSEGAIQDLARKAQIAADLRQLLDQSGIALGIAAVLAMALAWLVAGRVLRPLSTITATARRISASNLHERLNLQGPADELKDLSDTMDELFARLEAGFEAQQHFVANASHELRSPLTEERALLQVALDNPSTTAEMWRWTSREVLAANTEQERLIEALLTLASSESGLHQREPVDLTAVIRGVLHSPRPEIGNLGLQVTTPARPVIADGDPLLIERLTANLVDNAVRYNVPGGSVHLVSGTDHGHPVLSVSNTGPPVPPGEIGRLFEPFQRLGGRSTGHIKGNGLGLSIVRAIAATHGATISARPRPSGGLTISVAFPPPSGSGTQPRTAPGNH